MTDETRKTASSASAAYPDYLMGIMRSELDRKIAEAVQAERERAALIADKFEAELLRFGGLAQARPRDIANAIRGQWK